jgi:pilus assembly protein Flp/PilA
MNIRAFMSDENGATVIEYALIAGLIFLVIVAAVGSVGPPLIGIFEAVAAGFD